MKKIFLLLVLLVSSPALAEYNYVSPETYAVNEADMLDYMSIPRSPKLNIDELDKPVKKHAAEQNLKPAKQKKVKQNTKSYEDTMKYKFARWWVDQRYKREEEHHGTKHEIKVQTRIEKEKQAEEKKVVDN